MKITNRTIRIGTTMATMRMVVLGVGRRGPLFPCVVPAVGRVDVVGVSVAGDGERETTCKVNTKLTQDHRKEIIRSILSPKKLGTRERL